MYNPTVRIIAFANQKGGVGKTTSAINLAAGLALNGRTTVLLDCDPQANASTAMGFFESSLADPFRDSTYALFADDGRVENTSIPTQFPNLRIVAGSRELSGLEIELVDFEDRERRLRASLDRSQGCAEFVILDTPPSLGLLTLNCLVAADEVIIPVQCEFLSLAGVARLLETIRSVQQRGNPALRITGILPTMFDSRTNLAKEVADDLARHFPGLVFETVIPRSVRMAEAPSYGLPIVEYAPSSSGAAAYLKFAEEVLVRC